MSLVVTLMFMLNATTLTMNAMVALWFVLQYLLGALGCLGLKDRVVDVESEHGVRRHQTPEGNDSTISRVEVEDGDLSKRYQYYL